MDGLSPRDSKKLRKWNNARDGRKNRIALSNLREAVHDDVYQVSFPTPVASGKLNGGTRDFEKLQAMADDGEISEEERRSMSAGNGGQLNPDWVEWLMGWPIGWTDLEPLPMESFIDWLENEESWWDEEPAGIPRVAHGVSDRTPRLKAIGNGQVSKSASLAWKILGRIGYERH